MRMYRITKKCDVIHTLDTELAIFKGAGVGSFGKEMFIRGKRSMMTDIFLFFQA